MRLQIDSSEDSGEVTVWQWSMETVVTHTMTGERRKEAYRFEFTPQDEFPFDRGERVTVHLSVDGATPTYEADVLRVGSTVVLRTDSVVLSGCSDRARD